MFQPHDYYFAGSDGAALVVPNVRPFGSSNVDLGDINGLTGMPVMVNRVVHMDLRTQIDDTSSSWPFIETSFQDTAPAPAASPRYHVPLYLDPPSFPGVDPDHPDDPKPTFAPVPFVVGLGHTFVTQQGQTQTVYRNALLDTGAQTSLISHALAVDLNINLDPNDPNTDILDLDGDNVITADDYLPIGGLGGEVAIPFVRLSKISIPTGEGTYISLSDVEVGVFVDADGNVLDIPGLDSIFGMNLLTSGYFAALFGEASGGLINEVYLDFRDLNNSQMVLDLNADFVPEPALGALILLASALLQRRRHAA